MNKDWRSKLFELSQDEFTLNPLVFPVSRTKGSDILGICFRTWMQWEKLAMLIPEYKLQYIKLKKKSEEFGIVVPIVPYMVWCVGRVGEIFENLPHGLLKKWIAQEYVKNQQEGFTRLAYLNEQQSLQSDY